MDKKLKVKVRDYVLKLKDIDIGSSHNRDERSISMDLICNKISIPSGFINLIWDETLYVTQEGKEELERFMKSLTRTKRKDLEQVEIQLNNLALVLHTLQAITKEKPEGIHPIYFLNTDPLYPYY